MAYKIKISKKSGCAGEIVIETLDETSCDTVRQMVQQYTHIKNVEAIDHNVTNDGFIEVNQ